MSGQSVERLMDVILQMRINLAHVTETLHQQTFEIREQLGAVFEEEKQVLERCLSDFDERLEECSAYDSAPVRSQRAGFIFPPGPPPLRAAICRQRVRISHFASAR
jgi:hypothetical protein